MTREDNPHLTEYGNGWEHGYQDGLDAAASIAEELRGRLGSSASAVAIEIRGALTNHNADVAR